MDLGKRGAEGDWEEWGEGMLWSGYGIWEKNKNFFLIIYNDVLIA